MEAKRLGLCQKSLFVVPNHLTEQWASEFLNLYPNAKLLVARRKDFETANRKKFCARIATGDYDAVIIGHSQFERIPLSFERQERIIQEQIYETLAAINELKVHAGENFSIKQIVKRSQGQSAVAGTAYQSGERLFSEYDQKTKFYNRKKELVHAEIMLPSHAPPGYADRATLWNAVEAVENQWNSQLARRIVLAFPVEVPKEQYLSMIKEFCQEQFVSKGMIADFAIHDKGDGNPHAHILLTLRAMDEHGKWLPKARKVYDLDKNGERIQLPSGNWKCHKENTVDWNDQKYAEIWRHSWEVVTNRYLEAAGRPERVDLRSFERQGVQQIPTVHLGPAAHQMEKRGIETFLGNLNRDIRAANSLMQSIRSTIRGLQRWIADLTEKKQILLDALEKTKNPTLSDLLVDYFNLRNEQRSDWSGKAKLKCTVRDFEEIRQAVDYLKAHSLNTVEDLNAAIKDLSQIAAPLRRQLKQNENRMRAIAQIKDAAAVHAKLKPIHDTFMKKNFNLTKEAYAAQHKEELDTFNKAVRTLMKLNGSTAVDFSA